MPIGSDYYVILRTIYKDGNPSLTDSVSKGIEIGQKWVNTTTKDEFFCIDNTDGAARWQSPVFQIDPLETTTPDFQADIADAIARRTLFVTPEVIYNSVSIIEYDLTIPVTATAMSVGPVTIATGYTVTVEGTWTIV
jgi:hypothetical protein